MGAEHTKRINKIVDGLGGIIRSSVCNTCMKAKITRIISRKPMIKVKNPGNRVHVDLFGPLQTRSL